MLDIKDNIKFLNHICVIYCFSSKLSTRVWFISSWNRWENLLFNISRLDILSCQKCFNIISKYISVLYHCRKAISRKVEKYWTHFFILFWSLLKPDKHCGTVNYIHLSKKKFLKRQDCQHNFKWLSIQRGPCLIHKGTPEP